MANCANFFVDWWTCSLSVAALLEPLHDVNIHEHPATNSAVPGQTGCSRIELEYTFCGNSMLYDIANH